MGRFSRAIAVLDDQRGHLFPWTPVFFAAGIGTYFALPVEPDTRVLGLLIGIVVILSLLLATRLRGAIWPVAVVFMCLGVLIGANRSHSVAEPVISFRYYGPVEGRIVGIDRSASDKVRLTLDRVVLARVDPDRTPTKVRVSLHGDQSHFVPEPGRTVGITAHLSPPEGPVEPGGFDFQRQAWFQGLGAVGYTRVPVVTLAPAEAGGGLWLWRVRMAISAEIKRLLPGTSGGVAAAITVGDRSGIPLEVLENLRAANLAHLLAISGLHMGLLTGFVFASLRVALALVAPLALRVNTKKVAAICALAAGAVYLALSGGNIATERAFVMVAVMFVAVLFDRRAISLRSVAMAALIVLALRPEALMGPGFQMSFAATIALVAVFGLLRDLNLGQGRWPKWAQGVFALVVSSLVAGLATAPIAAAHFNQVPHYGLIANLLSVPLMGSIIIPAAVLAALLSLVGLHGLGLWIMDLPIRWIVEVADRVAGWDGALSFVQMPPPFVLPLLATGALFVILWRHPSRVIGALAMVAAIVVWAGAKRPDILISSSGGLVGVMTDKGRVLSKPRGDGFSARVWLENDGDPTEQPAAADRAGLVGSGGRIEFLVGAMKATHLSGQGASERVSEACATSDIVVLAGEAEAPEGCAFYDRTRLRRTGALAIWPEKEGARIVTATGHTGARLWNQQSWRAQ